MHGEGTPKFSNDTGAAMVAIGVREFECIGAEAPFDHPHIYLDMGRENEIICPYCSTLYRFDPSLKHGEARPETAAA